MTDEETSAVAEGAAMTFCVLFVAGVLVLVGWQVTVFIAGFVVLCALGGYVGLWRHRWKAKGGR